MVSFAVGQRLISRTPDYWDCATRLEIAVLENDTLASDAEKWAYETTANNLKMIERSRKQRSEDTSWLLEIISTLEK